MGMRTTAMDSHKFKQLRLLEEISANNVASQREFSKKLNISLGLVNSFIKRLVNKGYCEITMVSKKRARYILTPKGALKKSKLKYEYLVKTYKFYKKSQKTILKIFEKLEESNKKNVVFCGVGELAEIAFSLIIETSLNLVGIIDSDRVGQRFKGFQIIDPEDANKLRFDKIICTQMPDKMESMETTSKVIKRDLIIYLL